VVADIAEAAPFLSGVTVSGGEATVQWQFVHELFRWLAEDPATAHLTRLIDTNGDAEPVVWDTLAGSMHGAMVDLKALDPEVHQVLTHRDNARVLASIRQLAELGRLHEVRLLVVPGINDTPEQLAATARWLAELDPAPPVVVQGFRHHGARPAARRWSEATPEDLDAAAARLIEHGLDPRQTVVRAGGRVGVPAE
jgi:pyruvate formate lyase activating enzyme